MAAIALLGADRSEERRLQCAVGHLSRQWPAEPGTRQSLQGQPDSRRRNTYSASNLVEPDPGGPQTNHFAHLAHPCPLCWHPLPRAKAKGADPNRASRRTAYPGDIILGWRAKSSWNAERDQIGNAGRDHRGFAGDFPRNPHPSFGLPKGPSITNRTAPSLARRRPRESKVALPPQHRKGCS